MVIFLESSSLEPLFVQNNEILNFIILLLWILQMYLEEFQSNRVHPRVKQIQILLK